MAAEPMQTAESYVLRSKRGACVRSCMEEVTAKLVAERMFADKGVELFIFKQVITEEPIPWR